MNLALTPAADGLLNLLIDHGPAVIVLAALVWAACRCRARLRAANNTVRSALDGIRTAENYANWPTIRDAVDTHHQPRKENPQP